MNADIKAIQTKFDGYLFRSRLEARWAVFFKTVGLRYEYEPEGFDLDGTWYLPDFWLSGLGAFFEIKPFIGYPSQDQYSMPALFTKILRKNIFLICGTPGLPEDVYSDNMPYCGHLMADEGPCDSPYLWCECPECGSIGFQFDGRSARNKHADKCSVPKTFDDKNYNTDSPRLMAAYEAARMARFEE